MNKIAFWNNSQNRDEQAFNDMKTIIFRPINDSETPLDSFSSLEEVRFKFNQKYFSVDELLGKTFSYPLDTDHPTEASWLHQITPKLQELSSSNEINLSRWNIDDLRSDLSEIGPIEPEQINEISRGA
ncbi:hypothetical protein QM007_06295 [Rothia sp. SD9660Na]|uniref:hypothetical protein n=1 Tax=Rothia sp. SD9660Na TaxID=3047030 RepID=UPI0024BA3B05|nr:hypothetical protein [Rothia sp. SD9660Na]WHS49541.1 hypothetical protein QM007_06295 [Rothia sp. SD9660Na]